MPGRLTVSRRSFLAKFSTGAVSVGLSLSSCRTATAFSNSPGTKPPNILFIIGDDIGWADIGYNNSRIKTPNIDRLAEEGKVFEQHYVLPTCTPTRVGLMTGRYPSRYGITSPAYGNIFGDSTVTLPSALRKAGYETFISGKWHMGSPPDFGPLKYGFTSSYGYFHGQIDPYTHLYKTGVRSWHRNDKFIDEKGHATDLITDEAVRVIKKEKNGKNPFFLYVAYSVPHYPLNEPDKWVSMYKKSISNPSRRLFAASLTHMDSGIGRIIETLNKTGQRKDTLVVFVSDNGGQKSWSSKKQYKGRYADKPHTVLGNNLPLRGWKGDLYEGGIKVPALVNWPGVLEPGRISQYVHIVDWMPTLCGIAGLKLKNLRGLNWDGRDIWPLIKKDSKVKSSRCLYWKSPNAAALRRGDWKLIKSKKGKAELYNLVLDPYEKKNEAGKYPQVLSKLSGLLKQEEKKDRSRLIK